MLFSSQKRARYEGHGVDGSKKIESEDEDFETIRHCDGRNVPGLHATEDLDNEL